MKQSKKIIVFLLVLNVFFLILSVSSIVKLESYVKENKKLKSQIVFLNRQLEALGNVSEKMNFLKFKEESFEKRYPEFSKILDVVYEKSKEYGFSPELVLSIIYVESSFNPKAISPAGAYGLMQINYSVWKNELNIDFNKIFDIEYNIDLGLRILKHYYEKSNGDIMKALYLYNNGYKYDNFSYNNKVVSTIFFK